MNNRALLVLRVTLGITFVWIGTLIVREPESWAGLIRTEIADLMPIDPATMMFEAGIGDIVIGVMLILGIFPWIAGLLAGLHMLGVVLTIYTGDTTARDIGLMGAGFAVMLASPMPGFVQKLLRRN